MSHRPLCTLASLAALAVGAACSATTAVREGAWRVVQLDRPFSLAVGERALLDDSIAGAPFRVVFLGVTSDSRCPENAACVWEGDARVALRLEVLAAAADTAAHTTARFSPDPELGAFRVSVEDLLPRTNADRAIAPARYVVTLRVTRR